MSIEYSVYTGFGIPTGRFISDDEIISLKELCKELSIDVNKIGWYCISSVF